MDDASEAWMIDDVGTMDSDSEEESEQKKEVYLVPVEKKIDSTKETKPAIAGLPMNDASEAWMIDDVGNMDSASEEESEQKKEVSVVEEPEQRKEVSAPLEKKPETPKETKPLIAGLPMDDASEDWMIDDVGTMDSDSEEESEQKKDVSLTPVEEKRETPKETKPIIAGLPMDDASEAWMIDDVGTMDSDSEDEQKSTLENPQETIAITEEKIKDTPKETKPLIAGLPMDDSSDAWMIDDVGTMDSDSEDEIEVTTVYAKGNIEAHTEKINDAPRETKAAITGLPMEDASDAWMNDDVGTIDSDSDDEMEVEKEAVKHVEEMVEETKPAMAGLLMEDASDAWMNDAFGTIDSEEEDSIKSLQKEKKIIVEKIEEFKEKFSS